MPGLWRDHLSQNWREREGGDPNVKGRRDKREEKEKGKQRVTVNYISMSKR